MNGEPFQFRACKRCQFFVGDDTGGVCRRNPPTVIPMPGRNMAGQVGLQLMAGFPPVQVDTWCGEFALRMGVAVPVGTSLGAGDITWLEPGDKPS